MTSCVFNILRLLTLSSCLLAVVLAGPRYIAIPIDGVDVIELKPLSSPRVSRQVETYGPMQPSGAIIEQQQGTPLRPERATAHILDYVDFGGHTGPNGAFSWYADYPSHH